MSFFKDFKEDLSQAVNELLPEEKSEPVKDVMEEQPQMVDTITEEKTVFDRDEIADMLKNIDAVSAQEQEEPFGNHMPEEEIKVPDYIMEEPLFTNISEPSFTASQQEEEPAVVPQEEEIAEQEEPVLEEMDTAYDKEEEPAEERRSIVPIFSQEPTERPAPINTTMEDFSMETGIIIAGMSIKGDLTSEGNLDVMGTITGNIEIKGKLQITGVIEGNSKAEEVFADGAKIVGEINSSGSVKIGESSVVKGNIIAKSAVLAGAVKGDIDIQGPVILDTTAIIMGNIKSKSIQINNGAVIEGLCSQCYADVSPMTFFDDDDQEVKIKAKRA